MTPKNYKPENHPLIKYWQDEEKNPNLIHHRSITDAMVKMENYWLTQHLLVELLDAIDNYNYVMEGFEPDTFLGQYPHKFIDFFRKGTNKQPPFVKFISEKNYNPRRELLKDKSNFEAGNPKGPSDEVAL